MTRLKAKFGYYLIIAIIFVMTIIVINSLILQHKNPFLNNLNWNIIIVEIALLIIYLICFVILIKGHFKIASHSLLILSFTIFWLIMWFDKGLLIGRLDTIVYAFALLTATPALVYKNKYSIIGYTLINIIVLGIYSVYLEKENLDFYVWEYFMDNAIAMFITGIVAFQIFQLNISSITKVQNDLIIQNEIKEKLKASEHKYREMMELLPQPVFETDLDLNLTFVNQYGLELFEYTINDLKNGLNISQIIAQNDLLKAIENIHHAYNKTIITGNRYKALKKSGQELPVLIYTNVVERDNKPIGIRGVLIDITEREKAIEQINANEQSFRNLFEFAPVPMIEIGNDETIYHINNEFSRVLGYSKTDIPNLKIWWEKAFPQNDYRKRIEAEWNKKMKDALTNHTIIENFEAVIQDVSGLNHSMIISASFYQNSIVLSFTDITLRKRAEEAIKENELFLKNLLDFLPYAVIMYNTQGELIMVNKAYCDEIKIPQTELLGKNINEIDIIIEDKKIESIKKRLIKNGFVKNIELKVLNKKREEFYIYMSSRVLNVKGETVILSSSVNVTEKKKIEKELDIYRKKLENLVKERTQELANTNIKLIERNKELHKAIEELNKAQQKLVEAEKMASLGILAAGVAHEINNPLNFIHGGIIGLEDYFDENLKEHKQKVITLINAINTGIERASKIVTSLNHFSRNTDSLDEQCDIHSIIDNCLIMLENQLKYRIKVIKTYTSENAVITGNNGKLHQAILNILTNGIQAIENDGTITINTNIINNNFQITIKDSGKGIEKENINKIFDPFFTTKAPGVGSGLGLAITYNIIKEHNGNIELKSEINVGSTFKLYIPITTD
ncbi:MAG: PAS domain S-box protein [Bacteroidales bacterium]|nr:PAS domain S-box protein [Bacteroidales bacterium]